MAQPNQKNVDQEFTSSNDEDLITHMPPPIVHHFLNLIPKNKDRTRTCILSKTWNHLFLTRPNLVFHESDFNLEDSCTSSYQRRNMFVNYVDNYLNHCIEKKPHHFESMEIKLSMAGYNGKPLSSDVNMWIEKANMIGIKKMSLSLGLGINFKNLILDSHKLVQLHLGCPYFVRECKSINLPSVKILSLFHADLCEEALKKLVSGCPNVQFFHLSECYTPEILQLSNLLKLVEVTVSYCTNFNTLEVKSPVFKNFLHLDCGKKQGYDDDDDDDNASIKLLGCERVTKLQLSTWFNGNEFVSNEFKFLVELRLVCLEIKGVVRSQSVRKLLIRFCNVDNKLGSMTEIDCPNLDSLEYEENDMPFRFVTDCNPRDLRYEFSLPRNGRAMQINALERLFATTFIATENLKVVIVFGPQKDVIILHGLIDVMISILNRIEDPSLKPKTIITTGPIDWNAVVPIIYSSRVDRLAINVVSLCDSTFPKVVWDKLLSLRENQIGSYANVHSIEEDHTNENIPVELQQDQIAPYQVSRILLTFDWSMGKAN